MVRDELIGSLGHQDVARGHAAGLQQAILAKRFHGSLVEALRENTQRQSRDLLGVAVDFGGGWENLRRQRGELRVDGSKASFYCDRSTLD